MRSAPMLCRAGLCAGALLWAAGAARAQGIDLSHGGPVTVTAAGGIDWDQAAQTVTAHEDARAVRGGVTVTADRLIAHYRKKKAAPGTPAKAEPAAATNAPPDETSGNEIYRLEAVDHVHIFTATDQAWGDHAIYDMDQAVLVLTGKHLELTTPSDVMTARDAMEYWSARHMAVGRGDATVTSNDGRRITADTLVGYTEDTQKGAPEAAAPKPEAKPANADPLLASGKLKRVDAFGHVRIRTATEIITGDKGVYIPDTGLARIVGHVHITRGENQLNGAAAIVNMKTGIATLTQAPGKRVQGLVVPNEPQPNAPAAGQESKKPEEKP